MDGKTIYIMAGAPTSGKDTVIEFMTKHVFQDITDTRNSMVLSYSFIDDSRARADLIGIAPEKTKAFRKFLSDDADNLDNFDPENRGYGYRVYRFIEWLEKNSDPRVACIMVNLRQMKGIISMGRAVHTLGYRVRILKVIGRGLTPEEMSNEGDKEFLNWPDDAFHYVFDNSNDLDFLENQVKAFVQQERDEIERNESAAIVPAGDIELLPSSDYSQVNDYIEKNMQLVAEAMSPSVRKVELKNVPNFRPGGGDFNSENDFSLPKQPIFEHITVSVQPVKTGMSFEDAIKYRESPNVSTAEYAHIYSDDEKKDSE